MKQITLYLLSLFVSVLLLVGCSNEPPTPEELYKEEASGVVMVLNKFYYNVTLPSGDHLYFTSIGEDGTLTGLTDDINEIRKNCGYMTGTAFFINDRGMLLTNRHVASPIIDKAQVKQSLMNIIRYVKALYEARMSNLSDQYNALESQKQECVSEDFWGNVEVDQQRLSQIESEQSELQQQYNAAMQARDGVGDQLDPSCITIHPICELGIAYNDSYVSTESDFLGKNPCNVVRLSTDEETDLALLQLRSEKTPDACYVFSMDKRRDQSHWWNIFKKKSELPSPDSPKIDQQLYMIGFNAGIVLANTRKGIKVQMTGGRITQMPDGSRLLYSIPTMQGSSGSPVVDERGNLVGVNFAKLNGTDNFNFGIPLQKVRRFVME